MKALIEHHHAMWQANGAPAQAGAVDVKKYVPFGLIDTMLIQEKRNDPETPAFKKVPGMGGFVATLTATAGMSASQVISQLGLDYTWKNKDTNKSEYQYLQDDGKGGLKPLDVIFAFETKLDNEAEASQGRTYWDKRLRIPLDPALRIELERLGETDTPDDASLREKAQALLDNSFDFAVVNDATDKTDKIDKELDKLKKVKV